MKGQAFNREPADTKHGGLCEVGVVGMSVPWLTVVFI